MKLTLGIDIGKTVDPTAIALAEQVWRPAERVGDASPTFLDHYFIRHLERLDLGTDYPEIVRSLVAIWKEVRQRMIDQNVGSGLGKPISPELHVYVDATGVGLPVVDLMLEAGVPVTAVYFTHGDRRTEVKDQKGRIYVNLGKAYLVSRLQSLLQTDRIHLPHTRESRALARELLDYEIKVDADANDKYGAFKVGAHDDLVTALGLCVQKSVKLGVVPQAAGGYVPPAVPRWGQVPEPIRAPAGVPVPVFHSNGSLNNWGNDGGNGAQRYGGVDEVYRLTRKREGWTP